MDTDIISAVRAWIENPSWDNFFRCTTVSRNCTTENIPAMREAQRIIENETGQTFFNPVWMRIELQIQQNQAEEKGDSHISSWFA